MTTEPNEPAQNIWVIPGVDLDGNYRLTIEYTKDSAVTLDQPGTIAYATELYTAAAYANYDAAVLAQATGKLDMAIEAAAVIITSLRDDRPPLNQDALGLLKIDTGVSRATHKPFLHCSLIDNPLEWQWDPQDADQHASHVLQVYPVANLDSAYRRYLVSTVGLDSDHARAVVGDLANWRTGQ